MNKEKIKKIFLIFGFLIFVIFMAFLLWRLFFNQETVYSPSPIDSDNYIFDGLPTSPEGSLITDPDSQDIGETDVGQDDIILPQEAQTSSSEGLADTSALGGITQINTIFDSQSLNPIISPNGDFVQFYNRNDNKFYGINENGELFLLSNKSFKDVSDIKWSPSKKEVVIEFNNQSKIMYDFENDRQFTLPIHWNDFSFSPNSQKIISKSTNQANGDEWLVIANNNGSQAKFIQKIETNSNFVIPNWSPNNQVIAMYTKSIDLNRRELFFVGEHGQNFKSIIIDGQNFQGQWSQDGNNLLYSSQSPENKYIPSLWITAPLENQIATTKKNLNIETWAEKCTFANNIEIYCAVPKSITTGSGVFSEAGSMTIDDLYRINIETGQKTLIAIPEENYNISSIIINNDQSILFFTDNSGKINKINLQ